MFASWFCIATRLCLALHGFLRGGVHGPEVIKRFTIRCDQRVIDYSGHTVSMLRGRDSSLVNKCNWVGLIFIEGVDCLNDWWDRVLAQDPIFLLLGIHYTTLDDTQANVDDVMVINCVTCTAGVGCANEEAHWEGLKTFGGMPGGGHSLPICLAIFGRGKPILRDEPVKHVEKNSLGCFIWIGLYVSRIAFGRFARKTLERATFIVTMSA
jgi:hypothetical protein